MDGWMDGCVGTEGRFQPCGAEFSHVLSFSFDLTSCSWLLSIPGVVFFYVREGGDVSVREKQARDEEIMFSQQMQGMWSH